MRLKDRVVVITGAGSGIGRASAKEFAREGARLVVADINLAGAEETVRQISSAGGGARAGQGDVAPPGAVQKLVEEARKAFLQVHRVFNHTALQGSQNR